MPREDERPLERIKAAAAAIGRIETEPRPDDSQLLQALAFYTERTPRNVLRAAAWKAGDGEALAAYRQGRPLPRRTRSILDEMLESCMRSEREAAARCENDAAGMAWLSLDFLALAAVLLLFIG